MPRKKKFDEMEILQTFADFTRGIQFDRNLNNVHNPIYESLGQALKMPKHVIRKVILGMQPSLILQKYMQESDSYIFETSVHFLNASRKTSDGSSTAR